MITYDYLTWLGRTTPTISLDNCVLTIGELDKQQL